MANKKILICILLFSLIIRIVISIYFYKQNIMENFRDSAAYHKMAEDMLLQGWLIPHPEKAMSPVVNLVAPGIGWFLALIMMIFGRSWLIVFFFNSIFSSIIVLLVYLCSRLIFDERTALLSSLLSSIYYPYLKFVVTSGKEVWLYLLMGICIYLIIRMVKSRPKNYLILMLSLSSTVLIHFDERYLAHLVLFFILMLYIMIKSRKISLILVFLLPILILSLPWHLRNLAVHERPVIISLRFEQVLELYGFKNPDKEIEPYHYLSPAQIDSVIQDQKFCFADGTEIDREQISAMKKGEIPHNYSTLEIYCNRFIELWKPVHVKGVYGDKGFTYYPAWPLRSNLLSGLTYGCLLPFFLTGLFFMIRKEKILGVFFLAVLALHTAIHIMGHSLNRYRYPVDLIIIIAGLYGFTIVLDRFIRKTSWRA